MRESITREAAPAGLPGVVHHLEWHSRTQRSATETSLQGHLDLLPGRRQLATRMIDDMKFQCLALDQVVDPEAIRRDMVMAYFGGMLPGEPVKLNDERINDEAPE